MRRTEIFKGAATIADTIDWHRVKSVRTLCMISEIYEADKRYEDGLEILEQAYRRSPQSKTVLYRLADVSVTPEMCLMRQSSIMLSSSSSHRRILPAMF